ncbi:MAG: hypothetical protein A3B25_01105 [Candidatus Ryanbacteria bacterium RIFCSPLOWO2_01_FULL_48_26]|uniref:Response regulatory domain-containing protein n=1 Tax=Candidatus Ryanbacteria bacterium RIFCSPLOWO2_01_FULL_48_26 TaxID=1802126 RepID=A0A1G2GRP9_9BACT|nr:MAG: hypothetical protein A3B25_01105 [Candidatus Ryanbacteria bacterium RIFCSPLOWO2_01_FULL_48_26]
MREKPLILIADDAEDFREIISAKIAAAGFDFALAKNAEEVIQKSAEILPDLILMDIKMPPGPSGVEAALSIRGNPKTKDINVVFLTNAGDPWPGIAGDKQAISRGLGMQGYFDKGDDLNMLVEKIKESFSAAPKQEAPQEPRQEAQQASQ